MDLLGTAKAILQTVAPTIGTAIGGPFGGMAAKALSELLLGKPDGSEQELSTAIQNATPEQLAEIKKIENDFKLQMKKLDIDLAQLHSSDRNSARQREMAVKDRIPAILAILTMVSFFGYIGLVTFLPIAGVADIGFINIAVGWLGGTASTVVAYYFGSSSGSDKMIEQQAKNAK